MSHSQYTTPVPVPCYTPNSKIGVFVCAALCTILLDDLWASLVGHSCHVGALWFAAVCWSVSFLSHSCHIRALQAAVLWRGGLPLGYHAYPGKFRSEMMLIPNFPLSPMQMVRFHYSQIRVKFEGEDGSGPGVNRGLFASLANELKSNNTTKHPMNKVTRLSWKKLQHLVAEVFSYWWVGSRKSYVLLPSKGWTVLPRAREASRAEWAVLSMPLCPSPRRRLHQKCRH